MTKLEECKLGDIITIEGVNYEIVKEKKIWFHSSLYPLGLRPVYNMGEK